MLRTVALVIGWTLLIVLVGCAFAGLHTMPFVIAPAILLFGLLFERYIYKPICPDIPGPGWERTQERFSDPRFGRTVVVYYNKRTGERRYVAEAEQ
jgi:hypothetical protein